MSTKTITVTEEAYNRLAQLKKERESFSETINRITGKVKLSNFHGIISKEFADELEKNIKESRKLHRKLSEKRHKKLMEAFRS